jgi:hypothetical protein
MTPMMIQSRIHRFDSLLPTFDQTTSRGSGA